MKILVIGATGGQGTPSVKELIAKGHEVYGFTMEGDPRIPVIEEMGCKVITGNLMVAEDLVRAMQGMEGVVFIPVIPTGGNPIPELTVGFNVIMAAEAAGVQYMIHTSVNRAGEHETFERWGKEFWESYRMYWLGKSYVLDLVKACKIPHWVILKPAYMMDCFIPPKQIGMYPQMADGEIISARLEDTKIPMMCLDDVGRFVAHVFDDFAAYEGMEIDLAGDCVTISEAAEKISKATGKKVVGKSMTREEIMADPGIAAAMQEVYKDFVGMDTSTILVGLIDAFEWDNVVGYQVDFDKANSYGITLSTFDEWAERHKDEFTVK